jgi:hypothetical protein
LKQQHAHAAAMLAAAALLLAAGCCWLLLLLLDAAILACMVRWCACHRRAYPRSSFKQCAPSCRATKSALDVACSPCASLARGTGARERAQAMRRGRPAVLQLLALAGLAARRCLGIGPPVEPAGTCVYKPASRTIDCSQSPSFQIVAPPPDGSPSAFVGWWE